MKKLFLFIAVFALWTSCNTQRKAVTTTAPTGTTPSATVDIEERNLDTLVVTPEMDEGEYALDDTMEEVTNTLPTYHPSHKRVNDLLHTKLDLKFNWQKEQVMGKATLRFKPYFYPTSTLTLDAKFLNFQKITLEGKNDPLKYTYDDSTQVVIDLGRIYQPTEEYTIYIEYTATPTATGGSAAITSNQGLFFIDPRNEDPEKPSQIWSQGETEWNSRWFPTIDKPNER